MISSLYKPNRSILKNHLSWFLSVPKPKRNPSKLIVINPNPLWIKSHPCLQWIGRMIPGWEVRWNMCRRGIRTKSLERWLKPKYSLNKKSSNHNSLWKLPPLSNNYPQCHHHPQYKSDPPCYKNNQLQLKHHLLL